MSGREVGKVGQEDGPPEPGMWRQFALPDWLVAWLSRRDITLIRIWYDKDGRAIVYGKSLHDEDRFNANTERPQEP